VIPPQGFAIATKIRVNLKSDMLCFPKMEARLRRRLREASANSAYCGIADLPVSLGTIHVAAQPAFAHAAPDPRGAARKTIQDWA